MKLREILRTVSEIWAGGGREGSLPSSLSSFFWNSSSSVVFVGSDSNSETGRSNETCWREKRRVFKIPQCP